MLLYSHILSYLFQRVVAEFHDLTTLYFMVIKTHMFYYSYFQIFSYFTLDLCMKIYLPKHSFTYFSKMLFNFHNFIQYPFLNIPTSISIVSKVLWKNSILRDRHVTIYFHRMNTYRISQSM